MRIVQVVHGLPPQFLGGTETYAAHICEALALRGHSVAVFSRMTDTKRNDYSVDYSQRDGYEIARINNTFNRLGTFTLSYRNEAITRQFGAFLDTFAPDIVHVHHLMYLSTSCIQEATRRRIPIVM